MSRAELLAKNVIDSAPLIERLEQCRRRVASMCSEGRPPRMTIPVQWDDDDWFITTTLLHAIERIEELEALTLSEAERIAKQSDLLGRKAEVGAIE